MNNENKKTLVLDQDVVEALITTLRRMNRAGRAIAKQILNEGVDEENFLTIAQAAMVDWVYTEVKKANKDFEVDELEAILTLDFQEEETN
jgi:SOS response regulatory protein OraA/RecX